MAEKQRQDEELAKKEKELDPKAGAYHPFSPNFARLELIPQANSPSPFLPAFLAAIESLVATMNSMREAESKKKLESEATVKALAAELLKSSNEQNSKLVEAVNQAAKEMLNHNVQAQAKEMQSVLHGSVMEMLQDVGKIRESKRHLEHEIAELFSIKSRHFAGLDVPSHDSEKAFFAKYGAKYSGEKLKAKEEKKEEKKDEKKEEGKEDKKEEKTKDALAP